ncbi:hypothetical protein [Dyadobacter sp. LHD-138]|uniref:hypothetical protein n=1 Tax=Dyadobacter sp. LHD-138 TaxID=3071413 RepID=UPI0027E20A02|nr:hypothetical protein [Dyadobacter sp. LHD-138]MDQ6480093.1 hypothetical protein [Dyadobacter sp. LHD-138]
MKKARIVLSMVLLGISVIGFSQAPADFWAGKWELKVIGTPEGDAKFIANLSRKDGKLVGNLTARDADAKETTMEISSIEETDKKIIISFSAQGYNVNLDMDKVDENHLKGSMMGMFDAEGVRVVAP